MEHVYLVKNISPWMIDELIVFAKSTRFKLVLIREPGTFYTKKLDDLRSNGIDVIVSPLTRPIKFRKLLFCVKFVLVNCSCFFSRYSFVVGVKSIWWFLKLDDSIFNKPSSIHAQFATQSSILALILKSYYGKAVIKYFFTFHAYDIFFNNRWFVKLVNNSEKCFSISRYNIQYVSNKYKGLNYSKIELCRLGTFQNSLKTPVKLKSENFKVGFIGWFVDKKGISYLIEAMKEVTLKNHNIKLIIAGDGPLKSKIEASIEENNLSETINYVGRLDFHEKDSFFRNLDALALPSISLPNDMEGIPVVLMEAISYGLPLIATNISGIPEICIHRYNGLLVPERNASALAEAIISLYNDTLSQQRYSDNSMAMFNDYNIQTNSVQKLRELDWMKT